jgi:dihydroanticapsin dehydrogenase
MKGLTGKVAIVTGGASGIGEAVCAAFVASGTDVVIADVDANGAARVADRLAKESARVGWVATDTSDEDSVASMVDETIATMGRVDILVNGAAEFIMRSVDATVGEWQRILSVNVLGYALCAKHVVPYMRDNGGGAIVNISSISATIAQPGYVTYNTTKGAVSAMTRCLALDLAPARVRVNSVSPGTVWTRRTEEFLLRTEGLDRAAADAHPDFGGRHMLGRCADPSEIADAVLFLASDNASFITASDLLVDGGYTAQ